MTTWQIIGLVGLLIAIDLVVVGAVIAAVSQPLKALAQRYPACAPAPGAVWKEFQSARVGSGNWGGCVHVGVDAAYLHLRPSWFARRFGMQAVSLPWDDVKLDAGQERFKDRQRRLVRARIGDVDFAAPAWAMSMLRGEAPPPPRVP